MITKDVKFFILNIILVIFLTFLLGYLFYGDFSSGAMVLVIGWIIVIPVLVINTVVLYFSDQIKRNIIRWIVTYLPVLFLISFIIIIPLNAAHTPLTILVTLLISNTVWNLTSK